MRPGAHIRTAIEVLEDVLGRHRPAATALADWGKSHRFAGLGTAPPSATWSTTRCAAAGRWPRRWATTPSGDCPAAAPRALGLTSRQRQRRRLGACGGA
jgi:16S rRNA (cytosine967-C5)-methyltransferase